MAEIIEFRALLAEASAEQPEEQDSLGVDDERVRSRIITARFLFIAAIILLTIAVLVGRGISGLA